MRKVTFASGLIEDDRKLKIVVKVATSENLIAKFFIPFAFPYTFMKFYPEKLCVA